MTDVEQLESELGLPPIVPLEPLGESFNVYGMAEIARDYCGLPYVPKLIPGYWLHGWQGDWYHIHPIVICPHYPDRKEKRKFTLRQSQAAYLQGEGYVNAHAIGHPMVYLPRPQVARRPNSLLVMPCRSFSGYRRDTDCAYAEAIASLRDQFDEVVICISVQSYDQGDWVNSFQKHGFRMVRGASVRDRKGFHRMAQLLSQFEYVTTNGTGSQVAYAAYYGAKPSVWGPEPIVPPPDKPRRIFLALPELRAEIHRVTSVGELLQQEPWLGVAPHEAQLAVAWAQRELGEDCRLDPAQLQAELGWLPEQMGEFNLELEEILRGNLDGHRDLRKARECLAELEAENAALKEAKLTHRAKHEKAAAKAQKELDQLRKIAGSKAWKLLGKPFYNIEKRLSKRVSAPSPGGTTDG